MGRQVSAVLDQMSNVIVNVNQQCTADAIGKFNMNISGAKETVISGLNVITNAKASVSKCSQQHNNVDIKTMQDALKKRLDKTVQAAAPQFNADVVNLKAKIVDSISVNVSNKCSTIAVATVAINAKNIKDKAVIKNINVNQVASAAIKQCIQNASVNVNQNGPNPTLKNYLDDNQHKFKALPLGGSSFIAPAPPCESLHDATKTLVITSSVSGFIALLAIIMVIVIAKYK